MKKPEEYLENLQKNNIKVLRRYIPKVESGVSVKDVYKAIKQAQIDAIDATVKRCAEKAIIKSFKLSKYSKTPRWKLVKDEEEVDLFSYDFKTEVDKQSILQVAKELKKELE